jgi:hypothetical protein
MVFQFLKNAFLPIFNIMMPLYFAIFANNKTFSNITLTPVTDTLKKNNKTNIFKY